MNTLSFSLVVLVFAQVAQADVAEELAKMLAKHPEADADRDGTLTEEEAGRYLFRKILKRRTNWGTGIGDRSLIDAYEPGTYKSMPYRLMKPLSIEPGRRYPLVISLHGGGGVGDDNLSNLRFWNGVMARPQWRKRYPAFVLAPQRRAGGIWGPKPDEERFADFYVSNDLLPLFELVAELRKRLPIDEARIYVLGSSGGGRGTWSSLAARPELFAAAIPVCGRFAASEVEIEKLAGVPIWCFHGDADTRVGVENSRRAFAGVSKAGGVIKYTELRGVKHNSWLQAFTYRGDDESKGYTTRMSGDRCDETADVWEWLFRQRKPDGE